jgi:carbamoyl-phosphate synthase large subunit
VLGVQMKAVGETMAIGRTFKAAWQKGLRGLEIGRTGMGRGRDARGRRPRPPTTGMPSSPRSGGPTADRPFQLKRALATTSASSTPGGEGAGKPGGGAGARRRRDPPGVRPGTFDEIHEATAIDPWFLDQLLEIVELEAWYRDLGEVSRRRSPRG